MNPSMRLKLKGDTFFLPKPDGSVYFRNNAGSFRMEGSSIDQWIEKLIPVLNGEHTMEHLTDGLPDRHRERVYDIARALYDNGFVRDVSQDRPHQLPDAVLERYATQIEFLDSLGGSGAYRFQSYRQANVLAVGSGPFFVSLVSALLESGLPRFTILDTKPAPAGRPRISELAAHARKTDPEVEVHELAPQRERGIAWREVLQPFDSILYVSTENGVGEWKAIHAVCREQNKVALPAIIVQQAGIAGPIVHPDSDGCWESAWRRVHRPAIDKDPELHAFSSTAGAMLANVIVFEWFKKAAGVTNSEMNDKFYLLDLETLEGGWHSFLPHPLVNGLPGAERVHDFDLRFGRRSEQAGSNRLLPYFSTLSSAESGIFHVCDEGDLKQLPLSQCRVQAADPLSEGPAELLPEIICPGLTHEEARREAGLAGIEAYLSRMTGLLIAEAEPPSERKPGSVNEPQSNEIIGVGAGETFAEGVSRGLQNCLAEAMRKQLQVRSAVVLRVQPAQIEDERCRFFLRTLTTMNGMPTIGLGEELSGFPVVWIGTRGRWYGSVGLNPTLALRKALQHALMRAQNGTASPMTELFEFSSVNLREAEPQSITFPAWNEAAYQEIVQSALQVLERNRKRLVIFDLTSETFLQEQLAGTVGVSLREEGAR